MTLKPLHWALGAGGVIGAYLLWKQSAVAAPALLQPVLTDPKSSGQYQATYAGTSDGIDLFDV